MGLRSNPFRVPGSWIGGKSELHRAGWSLTATGGDPKESATENIPPAYGREGGKGEGRAHQFPG